MNKQLILSLTLLLSTPVAQVAAMDSLAAMDSPTPLQATCAICFDSPESVALSCGHKYCNDCLNGIVNLARKEQNLSFLKCPNPSCKANLTEQDIRTITKNNRLVLEEFAQIAAKAWMDSQATNVKQCPTPDCSFAFINELGADQADVTCPSCHKTYCSNCLINHDSYLSCEEAKNISSGKVDADEAWKRANTKPCPKCTAPVEKDGGCQHMKCIRCNYHFCWTCLGYWENHRDFYSCPFKEVNPLPSSSSSRRRIAQAPVRLPDFGPRAHSSTTAAAEAAQGNQLLDAAYNGNTDEVRQLIANGANVNFAESDNYYLHGITPLLLAAEVGHREIVRLLIEAGANVNYVFLYTQTPLLAAATRGHTEIVRLLTAAGANIHATNDVGWTPLHYAAAGNNVELVRILISAGADASRAAINGETPLSIAKSYLSQKRDYQLYYRVDKNREEIVALLENEIARRRAASSAASSTISSTLTTAAAAAAVATPANSSSSSSTSLASAPAVASASALTELDQRLIADLRRDMNRTTVDWRTNFGVTELSPAVVAELAQMPNLTSLMIGNPNTLAANLNNLTQLPDLTGLTRLQVLGVMNNNLTAIPALPASLRTTLNVDGNRLPAAEVTRLQGMGIRNLMVKNQRP